jgi:hypothetical protein
MPGRSVSHHLPGMVIKDAVGFAFFFGAYHVVQSSLGRWLVNGGSAASDNEQDLGTRRRGSTATSGLDVDTLARGFTRIEAVGVAAVSGATAGVCYHGVSYPMEQAQTKAPFGADVRQLLATGRRVSERRQASHL